jgi:ParB-like chromosome segregation protein Spo0J
MKTLKVPMKVIRFGGLRPINKKKLNAIKDSIQEIGLKTPPTVRPVEDGKFELVAGHHRIQALKELGRKKIRCFVIENKDDARLWAIAENLHRAELQPQEEAELLKQWERLLKKQDKAVQGARPGGRQPHDKGVSSTAKALGMSREKVRRLRRIGTISKEVRVAANQAGLGSNKEALAKIGKEKTGKAQLEKVRELSRAKEPSRHQDERRKKTQMKRLNRAFKKATSFRREWRDVSVPTRLEFIKKVLKPKEE